MFCVCDAHETMWNLSTSSLVLIDFESCRLVECAIEVSKSSLSRTSRRVVDISQMLMSAAAKRLDAIELAQYGERIKFVRQKTFFLCSTNAIDFLPCRKFDTYPEKKTFTSNLLAAPAQVVKISTWDNYDNVTREKEKTKEIIIMQSCASQLWHGKRSKSKKKIVWKTFMLSPDETANRINFNLFPLKFADTLVGVCGGGWE